MMACIRDKPKETIHSGHFMVSEIDESTEAEEEQDVRTTKPEDTIDLTEEAEECVPLASATPEAALSDTLTMEQKIRELYSDQRQLQQQPQHQQQISRVKPASYPTFGAAMKPTSSSMIPSERLYTGETKSVTIDASLAKLFACMSLAYQGNKITSPRWKNFKGLRLKLKDKIRLNNIIWRAWHMQYVKNRKPLVCQFSVPSDYDRSHNKPEAIVLEGKYWRRKLKAVFSEYQKWRVYFKNKTTSFKPHTFSAIRSTQTPQPQSSDNFWTSFMGETSAASGAFGPSSVGSGPLEAEEFTMDFTDSLFNSLLSGNTTFEFPNPREISHPGMSADLIQPGLVQLQPTPMDDFMDMEPFDLLMSSYQNQQTYGSTVRPLPTLPEETMEGMSASSNYSSSNSTFQNQSTAEQPLVASGVIQPQPPFANQLGSVNTSCGQNAANVSVSYSQMIPYSAQSIQNQSQQQVHVAAPNSMQQYYVTNQNSPSLSERVVSSSMAGAVADTQKNDTRARKFGMNWQEVDTSSNYASVEPTTNTSKDVQTFLSPRENTIVSQSSSGRYPVSQQFHSVSASLQAPQIIQPTYSMGQCLDQSMQSAVGQSIQTLTHSHSVSNTDAQSSYIDQQRRNQVQSSPTIEAQEYTPISANFAVPKIPAKLIGKNRSRSTNNNSNTLSQSLQYQQKINSQPTAKSSADSSFSSTERLAQILKTMARNDSLASQAQAQNESPQESTKRQLERTNSLPSYAAPRKSQNNNMTNPSNVVNTIQPTSSFQLNIAYPTVSNNNQTAINNRFMQPALVQSLSQQTSSSQDHINSNFVTSQSNISSTPPIIHLDKSPSHPSLSSLSSQSLQQYSYSQPPPYPSKKASIDIVNSAASPFSSPSISNTITSVNLNLSAALERQSSTSSTNVTQTHQQILNIPQTNFELVPSGSKSPQRRLTPTELQRKISPSSSNSSYPLIFQPNSSYPFQATSPSTSSPPVQCVSAGGLNISFNGTSMLGTCPLASSSRKGKSDEEIHQYREHRRVCHINAEQKRRCNIKNGFDTLRSMLPGLSANANAKISKAAMLQKAGEYIRALKIDRSAQQEEYDTLKEQINQLNHTISMFQSQLPATGASVPCQKTTQVLDYYDEYVRIRTLQNWKFWIFSLIMDTLLDSYNSTVSTNSVDELCKGVLRWVDQNCSLVLLRKDVLNSLRKISTSTNILTLPETLPEEAVKAVSNRRSRNVSANNNDLHT